MKQLLILSGKGGTGKTTIASSFIKLSDAKYYADCDVDAPNLHLIMTQPKKPVGKDYFGLPKAYINYELFQNCGLCEQSCRFEAIQFNDKYTIDLFSCEGCGVCEKICSSKAISLKPKLAGNLELFKGEKVFSTAKLRMGSGTSGKLVSEVKKQLLSESKDNSKNIAIIDGSPGIGCPVIASLSGVDMVLIVAEPSVSEISDMKRIIETADKFQVRSAVCINKFNTNLYNTKKIEDYCKMNNIDLVGRVPFDKVAVQAINCGKSVIDYGCDAADAIKIVYKNSMKVLSREYI